MFDNPAFKGHESVHHFHDEASGLRAVIAIHSTALGPGGGGCRMWSYSSAEAALTDALRLSEGMSYKNAMADLPLGGGKAVIWGDSRTQKTPALFRALGRAIESLGGRYWTAEDVGVSPADMAHVAEETRYVAGLDKGAAASGDPSPLTALGVFLGLKAAVSQAFGSDDLAGRTIAVQGVGHVGAYLCEHLAAAGARLVIADVNAAALADVARRTGARTVARDAIYDVEADVFSPNALGAVINRDTLKRLKARVVAGGANNQLATPDMGEALTARGMVYAPDYVINGGGIINVAAEISGRYDRAWVESKVRRIGETVAEVLAAAAQQGRAPNRVADEMALTRIAAARARGERG